MNLTGRVAVITGASQGIGRACALKLAKCGASVALVARNQQKLEAVAQEIAATARAGTLELSETASSGDYVGNQKVKKHRLDDDPPVSPQTIPRKSRVGQRELVEVHVGGDSRVGGH